MANTTLKPKCRQLAEQLVERAEQQLKAAFQLLAQQGQTHTFTVTDVEYNNGSPIHKQVDYADCIGCYCFTFRQNDDGDILVHYKGTVWLPLNLSYNNLSDLVQSADILLEKAQAKAM